jgi:hypothetical protein
MFSIPLWVLALGLAAVAPWVVGALQGVLERRRRERTRALLRELGLPVDDGDRDT